LRDMRVGDHHPRYALGPRYVLQYPFSHARRPSGAGSGMTTGEVFRRGLRARGWRRAPVLLLVPEGAVGSSDNNVIERINEGFRRRVKTKVRSRRCAPSSRAKALSPADDQPASTGKRRSSTSSPVRRTPRRDESCYTTPTLHPEESPSPISTSWGTRLYWSR